MGELAAELGVSRTTLFRWVGKRDVLLAEILWSLAEPTMAAAMAAAPGHGSARMVAVVSRFAADLDAAPYFREFVASEPEKALRVLTTRASTVQSRVVAAVEALLAEEVTRGGISLPLGVHETAYLLVRIMESFLYTDIITGDQPDVRNVEAAARALLGPAWSTAHERPRIVTES